MHQRKEPSASQLKDSSALEEKGSVRQRKTLSASQGKVLVHQRRMFNTSEGRVKCVTMNSLTVKL